MNFSGGAQDENLNMLCKQSPRGVRGACPPGKFLKLHALRSILVQSELKKKSTVLATSLAT